LLDFPFMPVMRSMARVSSGETVCIRTMFWLRLFSGFILALSSLIFSFCWAGAPS